MPRKSLPKRLSKSLLAAAMLQFLSICILLLAAVGCGSGGAAPEGPAKVSGDPPPLHGDSHDHAHPTEGPHHGQLIELGGDAYYAELTHDDEAKSVIVYLLDHAATAPVGSTDDALMLNLVVAGKPLQVKLAAQPQEGDAEGQASRYSVSGEDGATAIAAIESPKTSGRLSVTIAGQTVSGKVDHLAHGDHHH